MRIPAYLCGRVSNRREGTVERQLALPLCQVLLGLEALLQFD